MKPNQLVSVAGPSKNMAGCGGDRGGGVPTASGAPRRCPGRGCDYRGPAMV